MYELAYRTGGPANCTWKRVLGRFTIDEARDKQAEIERMGYKTNIYQAGFLDIIGLPDGWEFKSAGERF